MRNSGDGVSDRREFLHETISAATVTAGAFGLWAASAGPARAEPAADSASSLIRPGNTILFQGDSITDAGRDRKTADEPNIHSALGNGYAWMAASALLADPADHQLKIFNRGISGNKVFQLADRWQSDCLDLKPDVLSILIGVNDIWHRLNGNYDGTLEIYKADFEALLKRTKTALPDVRLVVCEPFVLKCGAINDAWFPAFDGYRAAAKEVAADAGAVFVPFQTMFDEAVKYAPPEHWARDGVHPSPYGASLMAHFWLKTVSHVRHSA